MRIKALHPLYEGTEMTPIYSSNYRNLRSEKMGQGALVLDFGLKRREDRWVGMGLETYEYLRLAKRLGLNLEESVPGWLEYSQREEVKKILRELQGDR